ncbi:MAG: hypothetical protein FWC97_01580 [Treponema sp.]|nr:hypothetical protein [Treponema sp.]
MIFSPDDWKNWDKHERLAALNELEGQNAIDQGRVPADVEGENLPLNINGSYDYDENKIAIDNEILESDEPYDALRTYYHESRHAYQYDQAEDPERADYPEQAGLWKLNFDNYIEPEDNPAKYEAQAIEQDAREYASEKMHEYNRTHSLETLSKPSTSQDLSSLREEQAELSKQIHSYEQMERRREDISNLKTSPEVREHLMVRFETEYADQLKQSPEDIENMRQRSGEIQDNLKSFQEQNISSKDDRISNEREIDDSHVR